MARVLVIDDDSGLLQMVKLMLERAGHQSILAEGGEAGIKAALTQAPDLAIIDLMMPGISGYDVTRQLRANSITARLPILILTARSQPMDKQMALNVGATAFMSKPVSSQELTGRIAELLNGTLPSPIPATVPPAVDPASSPTANSMGKPTTPNSTPPPTSFAQTSERRLPIGADIAQMPPGATPTAAAPPALKLPNKPLPVTAVLSLRNGGGGTTVAINLAFLLRRTFDRISLIDLSTFGGNIGSYLHLPLRASWADLLTLGDTLDARAISAALTAHPQQGIGVLGSPSTPPSRSLSADATVSLLTTLAMGFQQIVVDINTLTPASIATLLVAHSVLCVVGDDLAAVQANSSLAQTLQSVGVNPQQVRIIVNRSRLEVGMSTAAISSALGLPIAAELPYDVNQLQAVRRGVPTVVMASESAFALALQQLSRTFVTA